jgi:peptide/nickel transport system substrate-binding protein
VKSPFDSTTPYATDGSALLAYDPAGAGKLLDEAGWVKGADGYRYKGGQKLTLVDPLSAVGPGEQLVQDQLKKIGVDLQLKLVTAAQLQPAIAAGQFDLAGTYYTRADPSVLGSVLDQSVSKAGTATYTQTPADGKQVSTYFAAGLRASDPEERGAAYADLQKYLLQQAISIPVYERVQLAGVSGKVHGFAWTSEAFLRANDIWLSS